MPSRIKVLLIVGLAVCLGLLPAALTAADWPRFFGPQGNGFAPDTGINTHWKARAPKVLWKAPLTDDGYAGPAVALGMVYIIDHKGDRDIVRALSFTTGKEVWRFAYKDTGKRVWGFARATPVIGRGKVYTLSRLGLVHCLEAKKGKLLWSRNIIADFKGARPQWDMAMSPFLDGDRLIVCPGGKDAAVAALHADTGKTVWKGGGSDLPGYATPVAATIAGKKQYVIFACFALLGVNAADGKLLWRVPWATKLEKSVDTPNARAHFNSNTALPIVVGNTVFITTGYKHGSALIDVGGRKPKILWQNTAMQSQYSTPILHNGYVYCTSDPGYLMCLELKTGKVKWKFRGFDKGGLAAVDGTLIVLDNRNGALAMVRLTPAGYQELGRLTPLGGESRTAPIVANGCLIIRNRKMLACLSLR